MAANLKTDYKDFIPPESGKRYIITTDSQGYSTIQDATEYTQEGDTFGASDINTTNDTINNLTAADVGAVSQTVYQLTPQNGWEVASEASSCYLVVTGKLATLVARLKGINTTISSSSVIFTLPDGIVPQKYIDDVMACSGNFDSIRAIQIGTNRQVLAFSGSYTTGPYSINTSFLIN